MNRFVVLFWVALSAQPLTAQVSDSSVRESSPTTAPMVPDERTSRMNRDDSHLTITYAPYAPGLFIPKRGPAVAYVKSANWNFEYEYLAGSIGLSYLKVDFATFKEELHLFHARWFPDANSFNMMFGLGRRRLSVRLGDDTINSTVSQFGGDPGVIEGLSNPFEVESYVVDLGLGNRWQFDPGFNIGVDWFAVYWPLTQRKQNFGAAERVYDSATRDNLKKGLSVFAKIPSVSFMKLQLGWTF